jgi:sugar phosphate isomerase/epimerase
VPDRPPAEIPVALQVRPFESQANWAAKQLEIALWNLPPIKVASHFLRFWGLTPIGPGVDWEQLEFWTARAFRRPEEIGVGVAGVYGSFFKLPEGFSRTRAMDQAIRFVNLLADHAEQHGILVALEPTAVPDTLWPMYLDGLRFAREEIGRPSIRVMADVAYFLRGNQPLEHIAEDPEYCLHVHIAGEGGQPGVGDRVELHTRLFRILRDIGYERGVSAACAWVPTEGETLDFGAETAKGLRYLKALREQVYAE